MLDLLNRRLMAIEEWQLDILKAHAKRLYTEDNKWKPDEMLDMAKSIDGICRDAIPVMDEKRTDGKE